MPTKDSFIPTLPIFEGLTKWGQVRLRPETHDNLIHVELKRDDGDGLWKPIFTMCAVSGQIAFRIMVNQTGRNLVYDPRTNTFANLARNTEDGGVKT